MELNGVRYLDANDYYRIVITEEDDLKVDVNGKILYKGCIEQNSFSKSLSSKTNYEAINYIVNYFLNYNRVCMLDDSVYFQEKKYIKVSSSRAELLLKLLPTKENNRVISKIIEKFKNDRIRVLYENDYDKYNIKLSHNKAGYYTLNSDNGNIDIVIHKPVFEKDDTISNSERNFLKNLIIHILDKKDNEAEVLRNYDNFTYTLECDGLKFSSDSMSVTNVFDEVSLLHNNKLDNANKKQLKLEGF